MIEILLSLWKIKAVRYAVIGLILLLAIAGTIGYFSYRAKVALQEKTAAETEANRQRQKADGLQIIVNTAPLAANIEIEKEKTNAQAFNSNITGNIFGSSVNRDSSVFTGNSDDEFCRNFCTDSTCAVWRRSHECR